MGWAENERKRNIVPIGSQPIQSRKFQKNSKKFKKSKNIIMASFKSETRWDRLRMREKKYSRSDSFQPNTEQEIPKKQQKNAKNQKTLLWLYFDPERGGTG